MQYKGKLYGKIANKYIDLEATADEFDAMKKQIAFKQKDDLENKFDELQNDIKFLYEMKQRAINAFDKRDVSEQQYLYKMIDDWIHQLSSASAKTGA